MHVTKTCRLMLYVVVVHLICGWAPVTHGEATKPAPVHSTVQGTTNSAASITGRAKTAEEDLQSAAIRTLVGQLGETNKRIEIAVLVLTAIIFLIPLGQLVSQHVYTRKMDNLFHEVAKDVKEKVSGIDDKINEKLQVFLVTQATQRMEKIARYMEEKAEAFFDKDFSVKTEGRYLQAEYVLNAIWENLSKKMLEALKNDNETKFVHLLGRFVRSEVALRQMLSPEPADIFTGMGTLFEFVEEGLVPRKSLWKFIGLLRKQGRINIDIYMNASEFFPTEDRS